ARVAVVEARPRLGGRATAFADPGTGELVDNGQHLLMGCYHRVLDLVRTLGTDHTLHRQDGLEVRFRDIDGGDDSFGPSRLPSSLGALASLLRLRRISVPAKWRALLMMTRLRLGYSPSSDATALDVLRHFRQPSDIIERFWEPFILATMNASPSQTSGAVLVEVLRRSILAGGANSSLVIPRLGLSAMVEPFPAWLGDNGGELRTNAHVTELVMEEGRCVGVRTESGELIAADAVILAIPPYACQRLRRGDTHEPVVTLHESVLRTSGIVSTYLWFDRDFMQEPLCAGIGTITQWVFNRRKLHDGGSHVTARFPGHVTLTTSAADAVHGDDAAVIVERSLQELHRLIPASRTAHLLHSRVIKERRATMLLSPESQRHRPGPHTTIPNVKLCGDWTQTLLPATLEGAAESGVTAVAAL
ncbi:MAG: hydroxysqualene dehydroxylase HpnE, partial [Candidatus Kapaibacterium sp.]